MKTNEKGLAPAKPFPCGYATKRLTYCWGEAGAGEAGVVTGAEVEPPAAPLPVEPAFDELSVCVLVLPVVLTSRLPPS